MIAQITCYVNGMCDNIYRREKHITFLKPNTAAGQIPKTATFAWNTPGRDAKGGDRGNTPNVKQGRTQERGRNESGENKSKPKPPVMAFHNSQGAYAPQKG